MGNCTHCSQPLGSIVSLELLDNQPTSSLNSPEVTQFPARALTDMHNISLRFCAVSVEKCPLLALSLLLIIFLIIYRTTNATLHIKSCTFKREMGRRTEEDPL